jgi:prolipoprotein diacylglyceryltransferase
LLGLFAATALVVVRTRRRDREFRLTFLCALPFTAIGALGLDYGLRLVPFVARGFAGPPPVVGGIMAYGALAGLAVAHALGARAFRGRYAAGRALDRAAPSFGVLVVFGRLGCFLAGCEHGRPTTLPWATRYAADHVSFPELVAEGYARGGDALSLGLHPTPLYEAAVGLVAAGVGWTIDARGKRRGDGTAFAATALTYATGRFFVELFRGDSMRGHAGPLTTGQAMSLVVIFGVVAWLLRPRAARSRGAGGNARTVTRGGGSGAMDAGHHADRAQGISPAPGMLRSSRT